MGLFNKLFEKPKPKSSGAKSSKITTYETLLGGVKAKNRQAVLTGLGKNEVLKIQPILTGGTLGFEVMTSNRASLGTIPSKIARKLEAAVTGKLTPMVSAYTVTKDKDGILSCKVNIILKKD